MAMKLGRNVYLGLGFLLCGVLAAAHAKGERSFGNSQQQALQRHSLRVGYFGGSISEGSGASDMGITSWRALVTQWLRRRYPDAEVTEINAAIGGTGSELGAYRCQADLLQKRPDLVFVEFAVNDLGSSEATVKRSMEGIVRQIWAANPLADIGFVFTTSRELQARVSRDHSNPIRWQQSIADHYGIPTVDVGAALLAEIDQHRGNWETLTKDGTHPLDRGYAIYAQTVISFLDREWKSNRPSGPIRLGPASTSDPVVDGHLIDAWSASGTGWQRDAHDLARRYPHQMASDAPGAFLTYSFVGPAFGLYWLVAPDSGDAEVTIDGGPPKLLSSWDINALRFTRASYAMIADHLSLGSHTVRIKVAATKADRSTGHWLRIGAFLVR